MNLFLSELMCLGLFEYPLTLSLHKRSIALLIGEELSKQFFVGFQVNIQGYESREVLGQLTNLLLLEKLHYLNFVV